MTTASWLRVATIVRAHGVRGAIKLWIDTDFPEQRFAIGQTLRLEHSVHGTCDVTVVAKQPVQANTVVVTFDGWCSRAEAERWVGAIVWITASVQQALAENEYYFHEIMGCSMMTEDGALVGQVEQILRPGANDVWVVRQTNGKLAYVPYIADVVLKVEPQKKQITVRLMEGIIS